LHREGGCEQIGILSVSAIDTQRTAPECPQGGRSVPAGQHQSEGRPEPPFVCFLVENDRNQNV
jgi:hypothetical protein